MLVHLLAYSLVFSLACLRWCFSKCKKISHIYTSVCLSVCLLSWPFICLMVHISVCFNRLLAAWLSPRMTYCSPSDPPDPRKLLNLLLPNFKRPPHESSIEFERGIGFVLVEKISKGEHFTEIDRLPVCSFARPLQDGNVMKPQPTSTDQLYINPCFFHSTWFVFCKSLSVSIYLSFLYINVPCVYLYLCLSVSVS